MLNDVGECRWVDDLKIIQFENLMIEGLRNYLSKVSPSDRPKRRGDLDFRFTIFWIGNVLRLGVVGDLEALNCQPAPKLN